jgi:hypothetical protein
MQPISAVLEEAGQEASREDVIDAVVEENVKELLGEDEPIEQESWRPEEATYLSELAQFFESDPWINRRSTARMCQRAPSEFDVGVAAYKSRKLIKASVILDNAGTIHDALITSDMYIRPNPTITTSGALTDIGDAVVGLDPEDTEALKEAIASVLNQPGYEAPHIAPGDFARTISRAVENRQTVADYLE